ncbi:flagellar assembly protein T N-terminal domain-containing protein [Natroniella sulfidigena]|uniref:flagellar assembly protein T N-terminal domain-containing protein n=1 Tax=Natroniella sulfidigena TaxID=723921 RepID=UPI00200A6124|nr:flagellar assembly protein T N-terminal domain-containing protein [Natroniella sulfidigena]MCK8817877.1 flagellar assembly protein T N-terminal domain-containing protein [Natroniella sulfidigena]
MRINKRAVLLALIIVLFSSPIAFAQEGNYVEVEGRANISAGNLVQARDMATTDAFRNAVEKGVGVFIDSQTKTNNYELIEDSIFSQAQGYVADYEVLDTWNQDGVFYVKIRALVQEELLEDDLDALDLVIHRAGDPRVMVVIPGEEYIRRRWNSARAISTPAAEREITRQLLDAGFRLIDQNQVDQARNSEGVRRALAGDADAFRELRAEYDADLLVIGEATSQFVEERQGFYSYRATLSTEVVETDTAELVASHGVSESGIDITETAAARDSLANAGAKMGEYLLDVVSEAISDGERSVQLTISGISFSDVDDFEAELKEMSFVDAVYLRDFSGGSARFDLNTSILPMQLSREIANESEFSLEVTGVSGSQINLSKE